MIKNKKGFTLIELIIVMAIIGILAVVAIVAISGKSADARDARRLADMASVRTAMALSCADGDTLAVALVPAGGLNSEICNASGSDYITFTSIFDPSADTSCDNTAATDEGCAATPAAVCDYSFGLPADGAVLTAGATTIDPCDYRINFYQEGADDDGYVTEAGLIE